MTVTQGWCHSFLLEKTKAIHDLEDDALKLALYDTDVTLAPATTTAYSATNEVSGTGYTAGGAAMALSAGYPTQDANGEVSYRFDNLSWGSGASFTTAFGGLIYNSSKSNRAVAILKFPGGLVVATATLTIAFPLTLPALMRFRG